MKISEFNKTGRKFEYEVKNETYYSMQEFYESEVIARPAELKALFINTKGKFGEQAIAVCDGFNLRLPTHTVEDVKIMVSDDEIVSEINNGKAFIDVEKYFSNKYNKECYSPIWVSLDELPF